MKHSMTATFALTALPLAGLLLAGSQGVALAQVNSEIAVSRSDIQADRQAIVAGNLTLTEDQARTFWPLYREYRGQIAALGDRYVALLEGFAKNYGTLTDEQAKKMVDDFLAIQKDENAVKTAWVPKFAKVLPGKLLARFYQIENKLDTIVRVAAAAEIPLVDPTPND